MDHNFNEQERQALDSYKGMSVGEVLRRTREHKGLTIVYIADRLKIRQGYLEALEKDDVSILPGRVYAIGFVRSYAGFLGLDEDKLVYLFKNQKVGHQRHTEYAMPIPIDDGVLPSKYVLAGCLVALLFIIMLFSIFDEDKKDAEIPLPPGELVGEEGDIDSIPDLTTIVGNSSTQAQDGAKDNESAAAVISSKVAVKAVDDSWVSIRDAKTGTNIAAKLMKAGDVIEIPDDVSAKMNTGNSGGLEIYLDGMKVDFDGVSGEVRKNVDISIDALKTLQNERKSTN